MTTTAKGKGLKHPMDAALGQRLRTLRLERGISQEKLGERCGVTFQQIQKNESGTNRIGFSRLVEITRALSMRLGDVLSPFDDPSIRNSNTDSLNLLRDGVTVKFLRVYMKLRPDQRRAIYSIVISMAKDA